MCFPVTISRTYVLPHAVVEAYYNEVVRSSTDTTVVEGYDYGMAVPSCYIYAFTDQHGNTFFMDGFYQKEMIIEEQAFEINRIRNYYHNQATDMIMADPDVFRRKPGGAKIVGHTIADMFQNEGIYMQRGNNDIANGIVKITQYLHVQEARMHPILHTYASPYLFVSDRLSWFIDEITGYYWRRNPQGEIVDKPQDRDDHAMDTARYVMSHRPNVSKMIARMNDKAVLGLRTWAEMEIREDKRKHRYG